MKNKPNLISELKLILPIMMIGILAAIFVNSHSEQYALYIFLASCLATVIVLLALFIKQEITLGAKVFAVCLGLIVCMAALVLLR
jgi:peptidoglycan/LPS O-acetylase OafA/YrhL